MYSTANISATSGMARRLANTDQSTTDAIGKEQHRRAGDERKEDRPRQRQLPRVAGEPGLQGPWTMAATREQSGTRSSREGVSEDHAIITLPPACWMKYTQTA